ncbi:MAG TPA: glycerophosphodiester phosphodiesterase [Clostridiales bacterium]|nr:glycerophosphodiester phosphodiesterase [Clostridiales bacterium]
MNKVLKKKPLLFSHRGGAGLFPENTLYAFRQSVNLYKADFLELDIHAARDGELVVIHDNTVDRTTNGSGLVGEMTLEQLKKLDAAWHFTKDQGKSFPYRGRGITIPTLREVFEEFEKEDVGINIEIKRSYPNIEIKLYNLIVGCNMTDKVLVTSSHVPILNRFRQLNKRGIAVGAHALDSLNAYVLNLLHLGKLFKPKYSALQVPYVFRGMIRVVNESLVKLCKSKNIELHVWTINDVETMKKLIDMGVDGIMSDYPDRLYQVFHEYGFKN